MIVPRKAALLYLLGLVSFLFFVTSSSRYVGTLPAAHNYVVFSIEAQYAPFAPYTATLWHKMGFIPLVIVVSPSPVDPNLVQVVENDLGGKIIHVTRLYDTPAATIAQISRLLVALLPDLNAHDFLLTADADMWPLDKSYFDPATILPDTMGVYYANAYSPEEKMFPMCYLGAQVRVWRQILGYSLSAQTFSESLPESLSVAKRLVSNELWNQAGGGTTNNLNQWFADQKLAYFLIEISHVPLTTKNRNTHIDRLDRSNWDGVIENRIDAHLPRPFDDRCRELYSKLVKN